jgi:deoxyhypusine synthase
MKMWALNQTGLGEPYKFELDLHAEVFEACAYHHWGLFKSEAQSLATLILGGGVPKNYNLQPEPALGQVLGLPNISGYHFDVQIVTAPVTDGSLSSCPPAEAVTWGKVDKDVYLKTTESMQSDYSIVMPFIIKALLENRARYAAMTPEQQAADPKAAGYLRSTDGYHLYEQRDALVKNLLDHVAMNRDWLVESLEYPLAGM